MWVGWFGSSFGWVLWWFGVDSGLTSRLLSGGFGVDFGWIRGGLGADLCWVCCWHNSAFRVASGMLLCEL